MTLNAFASVSTRPPTPPKEKTLDDTLDSFIQLMEPGHHLTNPAASLETPPPSSSPSAKQLGASPYRKLSKKIRFIAEPTISSDDLHSPDDGENRPVPLRALPPSKYQKSQKSILKRQSSSDDRASHCITFSHNDSDEPTADHTVSILGLDPIKMIEFAVQHLKGGNYASRIDAYMSLSRSFRHFRNEPNQQALVAQLPQFETFLRRDLAAVSPVTNGPDSKLIGVALKWSACLFMETAFARRLSDDFVKHLADTCTNALEDPSMPKEIVKNQLYMLTLDRFLSRSLDKNRAVKILDALADIHLRVTGRSILSLRVSIIQKLCARAGTALASRPTAWIGPLFHGMISDVVAVRDAAIHAAGDCATAFGRLKQVTIAVRNFFEEQSLGEGTNFEVFCAHIRQLLENKQDVLHIPRLYSTVIMFLRGPNSLIAEWSHLTEWLRLFQTCLNGTDHALHLQALVAWNHMIFATSPSKDTSPRLRNALTSPIMSIMQRRPTSPETLQTRSAALSTYSLLLYYAFRPPNTPDQFDTFWSEYVVNVMTNMHIQKQSDLHHLGRIFSALLRTSKLALWETNRYERTFDEAVGPEEVPRLDSVRIRRNTASALTVIETFVAAQVKLHYEGDLIKSVWSDLLWAISEAGRRDIKLSADSKRSLVDLLNFLVRFASMPRSNSEGLSKTTAIDYLCYMAQAIKSSLGSAILTEDILARHSDGTLRPATTPVKAGDDSRHHEAALPIIFKLISSLCENEHLSPDSLVTIEDLLASCVKTLPTRSAKLQLMRACSDAIALSPNVGHVWNIVASATLSNLVTSVDERDRRLWKDYRNLLQILQRGAGFENSKSSQQCSDLVKSWIEVAKVETGDAGVAICILRPMSDLLIRNNCSLLTSFKCATTMLMSPLASPTDKMMESAKRILFGEDTQRAAAVDEQWFTGIVAMIDVLVCSLTKHAADGQQDSLEFIHALSYFAQSHLLQSTELYLERSHAAWLQFSQLSWPKSLERASVECWNRTLGLIRRSSPSFSIEDADEGQVDLLISGFKSHSRPIAQATIQFWNTSYGAEEITAYPSRLQEVLSKLQTVAHVQVNSRPAGLSLEEEEVKSFYSAEIEASFPWTKQSGAASPESNQDGPAPIQFEKSPALLSTPVKPSAQTTPKRTTARSKATRTKLRHEDSQVTFVTVESSPIATETQAMTEHQMEVRDRQKADFRGALEEFSHSLPEWARATPPHHTPEARISTTTSVGGYDGAADKDVYDLPEMSPLSKHQRTLPAEASETDAAKDEDVDIAGDDEEESTIALPDSAQLSAPDDATHKAEAIQAVVKDGLEDAVLLPSDDMEFHDAMSQTDEGVVAQPEEQTVIPSSVPSQEDKLATPSASQDKSLAEEAEMTTIEESILYPKDAPTSSSGTERADVVEDSFVAPPPTVARTTRSRSARNSRAQASLHDGDGSNKKASALTIDKAKSAPASATTRNKHDKQQRVTQSPLVLVPETRKRKAETAGPEGKATKRRATRASTQQSTRDLIISEEAPLQTFRELYNQKRLTLQRQAGAAAQERDATPTVADSSIETPSRGTGSRRSGGRGKGRELVQQASVEPLPLESLSQRRTRRSAASVVESPSAKVLSSKRKSAEAVGDAELGRKVARHDESPSVKKRAYDTERVTTAQVPKRRTRSARFVPRSHPGTQTRREPSPAAAVEESEVEPQSQAPSTPKSKGPSTTPSPPSSQRFHVRMSETAQRVIQSLRDAFAAAQELVLGPQNQAAADEIEDLHMDLASQLSRAKRDGRKRKRV